MLELQRITTTYVDSEDRMRLCGQSHPQQTVVLWLTQRLCNRLTPPLCNHLSGRIGADLRADVMNSFAQQAAIQAIQPQTPVVAEQTETGWLVHSVDVTPTQDAIRLVFKGLGPDQAASLTLPHMALRQWLGMVCVLYRHAGWPTGVWPSWLADAAPDTVRSGANGLALH